eukprot:jgi/Tetstr1/454453/TSEL_041353.t1
MPDGPSSQASAATTRVSTQLQNLESAFAEESDGLGGGGALLEGVVNMQKEVEKELQSQLAAEERARVGADILRRKRDKKFGAPSGGDEGAEQQHGDVDAHGADGEEAGIVEEADLVGKPADVRAAHTPRFILGALLANYPEFSKWDADMEKLVQMVLPYGKMMIKWPSVEDMLKGQGEELAAVGLSTTEDIISSTLDLKLVLQHRAMLLLKEGLKPGESLSIQLVADATGIFNATRTNGTIVVLKIVWALGMWLR